MSVGWPVLARLVARARPYTGLVLLALLLSLAFGAGRSARAYLMKPILDDVLLPHAALAAAQEPGGGPADLAAAPGEAASERGETTGGIRARFARIAIAALVLLLAMPVVQFGRSYVVEYVLGRVSIDMERDVASKLLELPLRFHLDRRRGDVLSRNLRDAASARGVLRLLLGNAVQAFASLALGGLTLWFISWQLALVGVVAGPLLFAVLSRFGRRIRRSARRRQEKLGDVTQRLVEILAGIKVIKAFGAEAHEDASFRRETAALFRRSMKVVRQRAFAHSAVEMLNNSLVIGLLVLGTLLVLTGRWGLTAGDLAAFAAVLATTYRPVKAIAKGWVQLMDAQPAAERFFEVLDSPVEVRDAPDAVRIGAVSQGVRLRNVAFSYGREPVLRDVSFEVGAGEVMALVGRTGAGKTTLVDLLLRFHDPTSGAIEIDGVDLRRIERRSLLRQIAVVNQEPFLFDATIRDNVRYGRPEASDVEVLAAARAARVDEFAERLPEGYDTQVGGGGVRLSGGQRQRIAIARALLKDPAILVLDEATSSLDPRSERLVQEAIDALVGGRTVFLIAHRLSTIRRADRIMVLEGGVVTQVGTHTELVRDPGPYQELFDLRAEPAAAAR